MLISEGRRPPSADEELAFGTRTRRSEPAGAGPPLAVHTCPAAGRGDAGHQARRVRGALAFPQPRLHLRELVARCVPMEPRFRRAKGMLVYVWVPQGECQKARGFCEAGGVVVGSFQTCGWGRGLLSVLLLLLLPRRREGAPGAAVVCGRQGQPRAFPASSQLASSFAALLAWSVAAQLSPRSAAPGQAR